MGLQLTGIEESVDNIYYMCVWGGEGGGGERGGNKAQRRIYHVVIAGSNSGGGGICSGGGGGGERSTGCRFFQMLLLFQGSGPDCQNGEREVSRTAGGCVNDEWALLAWTGISLNQFKEEFLTWKKVSKNIFKKVRFYITCLSQWSALTRFGRREKSLIVMYCNPLSALWENSYTTFPTMKLVDYNKLK